MAELNFDLFEHYHSRAVQGDGEAARELFGFLADRIENPKHGPLTARESAALVTALRRFAEYSDSPDKARQKWTPMRAFMSDADAARGAGVGAAKVATATAKMERYQYYYDEVLRELERTGKKAPTVKTFADVAARITEQARKAAERARKKGAAPANEKKPGVSDTTVKTAYREMLELEDRPKRETK